MIALVGEGGQMEPPRRRGLQVGIKLADMQHQLDDLEDLDRTPIALKACYQDVNSRVSALLVRSRVTTLIRVQTSEVGLEVVVPSGYGQHLDKMLDSAVLEGGTFDVYKEHKRGLAFQRLKIQPTKGSLHDPEGKDVVAYGPLPYQEAVQRMVQLWEYRQADALLKCGEKPFYTDTPGIKPVILNQAYPLVGPGGDIEGVVNGYLGQSHAHPGAPCSLILSPAANRTNQDRTEMEAGEGNVCVMVSHPES